MMKIKTKTRRFIKHFIGIRLRRYVIDIYSYKVTIQAQAKAQAKEKNVVLFKRILW